MRFGSSVLFLLGASVGAVVIATAQEKTDPRVGLKPGMTDAGQAAWNMTLVASLPKPPREMTDERVRTFCGAL